MPTVLTRDGEARPRARLWIDRLFNRVIPARTLYLVAMRRTRNEPFTAPVDIFPNW